MPRSPLRHALLLAALALLTPSPGRAQAPPLQAGALVRVGTANADGRMHRRVGALVAIGDSVVLDPRDDWRHPKRLAIPRGSVSTLEVGHATQSHRLRDATIGAVGGAAIGFAIADHKRSYSCGQCDGAAGLYQATDAFAGGAIGFLGGALIGAVIGQPRMHWTRVALPARPTASASPGEPSRG